YIIDEAHMVTSAGFNALLKVVEEPPPHVKFVFATTEPEKVIGTIRSRTHHYPFRLVPPARLTDYLGELCEREGVQAAKGELLVVSAVPDGAGSVLRGLPEDQLERMRDQATRFGAAELSRAADVVNTGLTELTGATAPRLQLELLCARVLLPAAAGEAGYGA